MKLQAAVEERARVAKEKELETARLRARQERAADRQAEIDELRARRSAAVLCRAVLAVLHYVALYYAVLLCSVLCCAVLCCANKDTQEGGCLCPLLLPLVGSTEECKCRQDEKAPSVSQFWSQ